MTTSRTKRAPKTKPLTKKQLSLAKRQAKAQRDTAHVLSCDPAYRAMVRAWRSGHCPIEILSDYREEHGAARLAPNPTWEKDHHLCIPSGQPTVGWHTLDQRDAAVRDAEFAAANRDVAVAVGTTYHRLVRSLFTSKHGDVLYGRGGQETTDRDRYSKKWHRSYGPARNLNGGARIVGHGKDARIVLETVRGTEAARLPMPPKDADLAVWILTVS